MNKQEREPFRKCVKGMTPHNRAWVLNRNVTALLDALDEKDTLISDLIELADEHVPANCGLEQMKARAAQ